MLLRESSYSSYSGSYRAATEQLQQLQKVQALSDSLKVLAVLLQAGSGGAANPLILLPGIPS